MMPHSSVLPNECDSGSHRYCRSSACRRPSSAWRCALPDPAAVQQFDALGPAGGAGGVDQRGEVVGGDALDDLLDQRRVLGEHGRCRAASSSARVSAGHLGLAVPSMTTTWVRSGRSAPASLAAWAAFSAKSTFEPESREDERGVLGLGRRVDRGGGRAGAHDAEVGEDPLEPGVGEDRDPVLRADAEVVQAGGDRLGAAGDLASR